MSNSFSDVKRIICNSYIFFFERCFRKRLTFLLDNNIISMLKRKALSYVALAQLDRASGYGPEGQGFESLMLRQEQIIRTHKPSSYYFLQRISLQPGFIYKIFNIFGNSCIRI